jgi:hypothetical protein
MTKIKKNLEQQGVRNESYPEDRNEQRQLIFKDKTLEFDGSLE